MSNLIFSNVKNLTLPEGDVLKIERNGVLLWKREPVNVVPTAIDTDGSIYEGTGYIEGYRVSSNGSLKAQTNTVTTGYIAATPAHKIRMSGVKWEKPGGGIYNYICFYDADFKLLQTMNVTNTDTNFSNLGAGSVVETDKAKHSVVKDANGVYTFNLTYKSGASYSYIRLSVTGNGSNMFVTLNEEIDV